MTHLSSDRPNTTPKEDLFGHAPFAESLAKSICAQPDNDGLVMAFYGPWGSGKSTVLSYVRYFLEQRPKIEQPVVVVFNPWWFSGQENLARAFLGQMQAVLPAKNEKFKKLGDLFSDFAEGVGGLVDLTGVTGGAGGLIGGLIGKFAKRKPKDVPAIKEGISEILRKAETKVLVIIDDIDRLAPEETRQLFTVIKALADFPNVIYLLAFDREVAARAIEQQSGLPGARYLEKIIQVPFELPPIDRMALRAALFKRLDKILGDTQDDLFDQTYWANVFHDGIDSYFKVPRDVIRFTNTLEVTYPAVRGEVNAVDFIALEALRIFAPELYNVIRNNQDRFSGHTPNGEYQAERQENVAFHEQWKSQLSNENRESTQALLDRIFPKIAGGYGADWLSDWRKQARACHPDIFPIYFRLSVPSGSVSRSEMLSLLKLATTPELLGEALVKANSEVRLDGLSKARVMLERLLDHVEKDIPIEHAPVFINVLFDMGDYILNEDIRSTFDFGNALRIYWIIDGLAARIASVDWFDLLIQAFEKGRGIETQRYYLSLQEDVLSKPSQNGGARAHSNIDSLELLKASWIKNFKIKVPEGQLLSNEKFTSLLWAWFEWGDSKEAKMWCEAVVASDLLLPIFLTKFLSYTRSHASGDRAYRYNPRLNPKNLEKYVDLQACKTRLLELQKSNLIPEDSKVAVSQFLKEFEMILAGKDPDGFNLIED
ncbi:MAG: NTPase [Gammaproteobacteria bacterium]|nr:MAG: NTPase [Gammaproteobacteria bacterium]